MGDIADMIVEGEICQLCNEPLHESTGVPTTCPVCLGESDSQWTKQAKREWTIKYLDEIGATYTKHNNGNHLILYYRGAKIHLWPSTEAWRFEKTPSVNLRKGRGLKKLFQKMIDLPS